MLTINIIFKTNIQMLNDFHIADYFSDGYLQGMQYEKRVFKIIA